MDTSDEEAIRRLEELYEQCRGIHRASYPDSTVDFDGLNLTGRLSYGRRPCARGHYSDVYKGELDNGAVVAVKLLRLPEYSTYNDKVYRTAVLRFFREANIWCKLRHAHIASMLGFTLGDGNLGLVSVWQPNGTLAQFLQSKGNGSKLDLVLDVAEGIQHLHTCSTPLIHGDLKAANVLVNEGGIASIADFGISRQMEDINRTTGFTTTSGVKGTTHWMAPELSMEDFPITFSSDVYSCAGVFLEICCPGKFPYHYISTLPHVIRAKDGGETPLRAEYPEMNGSAYDPLWELMMKCWEFDPQWRPDICEVVIELYRQFRLRPRLDLRDPYRPFEHCGACKPAPTRPSELDQQTMLRPFTPCPAHQNKIPDRTVQSIVGQELREVTQLRSFPAQTDRTSSDKLPQASAFDSEERALTDPPFSDWIKKHFRGWEEVTCAYSTDVIRLHKPWTWLESKLGDRGLLKGFHWTPSAEPFHPPKRPASIGEVWKEYCYGINGHLSVRELNRSWGGRWKRENNKPEWTRRSAVIKTIIAITNAKPTWDDGFTLEFLEEKFKEHSSRSLSEKIQKSRGTFLKDILLEANRHRNPEGAYNNSRILAPPEPPFGSGSRDGAASLSVSTWRLAASALSPSEEEPCTQCEGDTPVEDRMGLVSGYLCDLCRRRTTYPYSLQIAGQKRQHSPSPSPFISTKKPRAPQPIIPATPFEPEGTTPSAVTDYPTTASSLSSLRTPDTSCTIPAAAHSRRRSLRLQNAQKEKPQMPPTFVDKEPSIGDMAALLGG